MKQTKLFFLLTATVLMAGCKEKIELNKVDSSMQVNTGIAAPVVTIKAPLSEILGMNDKTGRSSQVKQVFAKMPNDRDEQLKDLEDSTLFFRDTFDISRDFHPINLSSFIQPIVENLNIYEQAQKLNYPITAGKMTIPAGTPAKFSFPLTITLDNLNNAQTDDRVDLMRITTAKFRSFFSTNFGLKDADIQSVKLKMPAEFTTWKGRPMSDVRIPYHVEGDTTFIEMKKFLINLQSEGADKTNRRQHMINKVTFTIEFSLFTTQDIVVDASSTIRYTFDVQLLNHEALYGYFNPSTWMEDKDTLVLAEEWPAWKDIKNLKMRFLYPSIRLIAKHQIGTEDSNSPLNVNLKYIGVADEKMNNQIFAKFGENGDKNTETWPLYESGVESSWIESNPDNTDFGKWATNEYIVGYTNFNSKKHVGDVDKLFDIRPDVIFYDYTITVGDEKNPAIGSQLRLVNNTKIDLHAVTVVPFVLGEGSEVSYTDTVAVDFSNVNFDSITNSVEWLDKINSGVIYLYLYVKNSIPFNMAGDYKFLNGEGTEVELPLVDSKDGKQIYHVDIPSPEAYDVHGKVTKTGNSTIILRVSHEDFDKLKSIKKIVFTASLKGNPKNATIYMRSGLDVTVGISATIDAVLKLF